MLYIRIGYPEPRHEREILQLARTEARTGREPAAGGFERIGQEVLFAARREVLEVYLAETLEEYLLHMVLATRNPGVYGEDFARWLQYGASPRASIALDRCARARALLHGRDFVAPEDIQSIAPDVLRHRLIMSYEAEADGVTADRVIAELIRRIAVP
jgi:MoxR-like ATPase